AGLGDDDPQDAAPAQAPAAPPAIQSNAGPGLRGVAASEGVAIGPAFAHFPAEIEAEGRTLAPGEIDAELERLRAAVASVQARMDASLADGTLTEGDRGIVVALRDITADESLIGEAEAIVRRGLDAVSAVL